MKIYFYPSLDGEGRDGVNIERTPSLDGEGWDGVNTSQNPTVIIIL